MRSELRRIHVRKADDNPLLHVSLGLLSSFDALARILDVYAPEAPQDDQHSTLGANDHEERNSDEDHGIDFVLGLLAFRTRVEAQLAAAAAGSEVAPAPEPPALEEEARGSIWR